MSNYTNSFYTAQLSRRPYVAEQSALWPVDLLFFNSLFIHILHQQQRAGHTEAAFGQRTRPGKDEICNYRAPSNAPRLLRVLIFVP